MLDHFRIGERGDVAHIAGVGDGCKHAPHYFARTGFGHVGHYPHVLGSRNLAYLSFNRARDGVAGKARPVAPVLALRVSAILGVIGLHVALAVAPDGLERARPRVRDADVSSHARALRLSRQECIDLFFSLGDNIPQASRVGRIS